MQWRDYFKIVLHPNPGHWYVHWVGNSKPINGPFFTNDRAEEWISENYRHILDYHFEKEFLT